jgi:glutathione S-transferase
MTGADILMSFPIEAAATRTSLSESHPALNEFQQRIRALPAYKCAIEKGGPYELLGTKGVACIWRCA